METGTPKGCEHALEGLCPACEATRTRDVMTRVGEVMREGGIVDPAEQYAVMLGTAVAGFAHAGTELAVLQQALEQAYRGAKR
jgi:hypothetical protein